ncbi:MAG: hypothetical protein QOF76_2654, partial [Solirubrobacteraceae bacterium]|nr:hypothetical protein [Solirubrobacteraceae bacterium]
MAVSFSADGAVGTIVLDKPPANSYDKDYMEEFEAAIAEADGTDVRVVVVRSTSERFFCAGADIKAFAANDADTNIAMIRKGHEVLASMAKSEKLFLAWVEGHALGGGLEIGLGCDLRYALDGDFKMGTPEINLGILPGNGGTQRLPRLIGRGPALHLLLTGQPVSPQEAHRLGIVNGLFDSAEDFDTF